MDNNMEWQPIETAPKDGTRFLIATDSFVNIAFYSGGYIKDWMTEEIWEPGEGAEHWMPLPNPPKPKAE